MHAKTDSEGTSVDTSWAPRSPPRRPVYYVQSPSNHDVEKMSYGSSPTGSPAHHYYHCSPIHHSRESSTSRFSASLKNPRSLSAWKHVRINQDDNDDDEMDDDDGGSARNVRLYLCGFLFFVLLFTIFCLILWGASKAYKPEILVKNMVFENFNVQAGSDQTGVPTDMLSLNSTVKIHYRNPATFFAVHVASTPLELHYYQLRVASGQMKKFTQSRKSQRRVITVVQASEIPLYGGVPLLANAKDHVEKIAVPLNLTFVVRSRAYILGRLVKSKFYKRIRCPVTLHGNKLGKPINLTASCVYH
ncbi:hypothetical protein P3X46_000769 [Hevea brasiliensis]|uniref:Late embryogenesis abundant protein LEA-2 subgroup domain-containing protein n=1 Tax=Hevea brasiliensis TaxID=3981 RepID=A0ABQ9NAE5_HEVBR|nr:uncharacterized protein LOC110672466 isoform X2 [Hevea brasiliensis]KAJ9189484.1 hypothetical protein P3X46_000769 [Hevea brasiliensis]